MLQETETEETIVFFLPYLSLLAFRLRGPPHPPATPMILKQIKINASLSMKKYLRPPACTMFFKVISKLFLAFLEYCSVFVICLTAIIKLRANETEKS